MAADHDEGREAGPEMRKLTDAVRFAFREAGNPSLREVARRSDRQLSASTISRMMTATKPPKLANLLCLLAALGVPESEMPAWRERWHRAADEADPISAPAGAGQDAPPPAPALGTFATTCTTCGALVANLALHLNWHRGHDNMAALYRSPKSVPSLRSSPRPAIAPVPSAR